MTAAEFKQIALSFPGAREASHMGHPDFRVRGKIFATLGSPDDSYGVLMLTPDDQQNAMDQMPEAFTPAKGAWGRRGNTLALLHAIRPGLLDEWLERAWLNKAPNSERDQVIGLHLATRSIRRSGTNRISATKR